MHTVVDKLLSGIKIHYNDIVKKKVPKVIIIIALILLIELRFHPLFRLYRFIVTLNSTLEKVTLISTIDGDTLLVNKANEDVYVRLLGINTPEDTHCEVNDCNDQGKEATAYMNSLIEKGQSLYLEYDEERYDQYGRLLAYVWLKPDPDRSDYDDFLKNCLNARIISGTYCELEILSPNERYKLWLERAFREKK